MQESKCKCRNSSWSNRANNSIKIYWKFGSGDSRGPIPQMKLK